MALVKKNVCDPTKDMVKEQCWRMEASTISAQVYYVENHYSSEMHFLPRPRGQAEDDGVLVTIVFDGVKAQVGGSSTAAATPMSPPELPPPAGRRVLQADRQGLPPPQYPLVGPLPPPQ